MSQTYITPQAYADNLAEDGQRFSVHTIGVWAHKWWPGAIEALKRTQGVHHIPFDKNEFGTSYRLHNPTAATLRLVARWQLQGRPFTISRVDVVRCEDAADADQMGDYMEGLFDRLRLRRDRNAPRVKMNPLNFYVNGNRRTICCYSRPNSWTVRTELRFMNADAVRRAGLSDMHSLPGVDLRKIFYEHVALRSY